MPRSACSQPADVLRSAQPIAYDFAAPWKGSLVRKVTLQDLAEQLGVARSTVSRALRDDLQISAATRARVRRLAHEAGYHPNAAARALTHRSSGAIGLVLPRSARFVFANPYFSDLLDGIASVAEPDGFPLLVSASRRPDYARWLQEGRVDGLIALGSSLSQADLELLEGLAQTGAAIALIGPPATPSTLRVVACDERPGIECACEHLRHAGHTRVALVAGPAHAHYARARARAWQDAAERAYLTLEQVVHGDDTFDGGKKAATSLLATRSAASAWLFGNDLMAFGALRALDEAGRASPDDVAMIGFDDVMPAALLGLSTIHQPSHELGADAMRSVAAELRRTPHTDGSHVTHFVPRRTSEAPSERSPRTTEGGRIDRGPIDPSAPAPPVRPGRTRRA